MAERGGYAPQSAICGSISLAKNPGSLVRFTFHWCPWQDSHLHWSAFEADVSALDYTGVEMNAPGRIRTDTSPGLSRPSLLLDYGSEIGPGGRICTRTGSVLSGVPLLLGYAGEN